MNTIANNRIVVKKNRKLNQNLPKASMGIYIFDWARLRNMLVAAEKSDISISDFR